MKSDAGILLQEEARRMWDDTFRDIPVYTKGWYDARTGKDTREVSGFHRRLLDEASKEMKVAEDNGLKGVLADRNSQYGDFRDQGQLAQDLKTRVQEHSNWRGMEGYQREAIDMILHKIARIVNGNPLNLDSWLDIAGYAECARVRCEQDLAK